MTFNLKVQRSLIYLIFQTRRLQRGLKQIEDLMRSVKRGKNIKLDEIPPEIAVKTSKDTNDKTEPSIISTSEDVSSPKTPIINQTDLIQLESDVAASVPSPSKQLKPEPAFLKTPNSPSPNIPEAILPKTPEIILPKTPEIVLSKTPEIVLPKTPEIVASTEDQPIIKSSVSEEEMKTLEDRKAEYRAAALKAKHENNRELALEHFRTLKVNLMNKYRLLFLYKFFKSIKNNLVNKISIFTFFSL